MELICLENASHRKDRISSSISSLLHFISWPQLISQISKGQVGYQEQLETSRYSRGPSQSKPRKNPSSPTEAVCVEAQDTSGFHPNLKRYWHSAEALEALELTCKVKIAKSIFILLFLIVSLSGVSLSGVK